ncbi:MAG: MobA/MobL family protein [Saccharofermentans sp.]|nr:MobA/MobL family protein [Saccharofermentans sp.]
MSIYHCSIKIVSRAGGRSTVASAAYRAGEKLYNEETGLTHDFTHKGGVVMNEVILPDNAPRRYLNREVLWNEVQQIEKRSDAQFAREIEVALPNEMTREQQIECVRNFIQDNFIKEGMIADWALHDKGDGNPHAHIMLTLRGIDEHEKWLQKQKTVFANSRDKEGRPIYDPSLPSYDPKNKKATSQYRIPQLDKNGNQKTRVREGKGTEYLWEKISIPANDWNEHSKAEKWRSSWAEHCNRYLAKDKQIDHRSYARQGIDKVPTIHEGVVARQMEAEGKNADRCQINREVRERNSLKQQIRDIAEEITKLITEKARSIYGRFEKLRRALGDPEGARADAGSSRTTAGGERFLARAAGRIAEAKRAADDTEQAIARTDNRIIELKNLIKEAKENIYERFERLKARRNARYVGEYAGSVGSEARGELQSTQDSIGSFLRELDSKERASEEKRQDYRAEHKAERSGSDRSGSQEERRDNESRRESPKGSGKDKNSPRRQKGGTRYPRS